MVLDQSVNGLGCKLECNLVLRHHVNVHDVGLDVNELVVEHCFDQRIGVLAQLGVGSLGQHDGAQRPDGGGTRQGFGETAIVLRYAVERALDPVDALQRLCQPLLDLCVEDDGGSGARREGCGRSGQQVDGHRDSRAENGITKRMQPKPIIPGRDDVRDI